MLKTTGDPEKTTRPNQRRWALLALVPALLVSGWVLLGIDIELGDWLYFHTVWRTPLPPGPGDPPPPSDLFQLSPVRKSFNGTYDYFHFRVGNRHLFVQWRVGAPPESAP